MCIHVFTYICICTFLCIYIYIDEYIDRYRERDPYLQAARLSRQGSRSSLTRPAPAAASKSGGAGWSSASAASYAYVSNTRNKENNTVFYSYSACFVNTLTLNIYVSMSYTELTRRNTVFVFLWVRHRNT